MMMMVADGGDDTMTMIMVVIKMSPEKPEFRKY